jgi:hypothetical protein
MKTSEDLKYLGETLFGVSLPEDSREARETFSQLFKRTLYLTTRGADLVQILQLWDPQASSEGDFFSTAYIRFGERRYNVLTPKAYPRLVALTREATSKDVVEVLVSCESHSL